MTKKVTTKESAQEGAPVIIELCGQDHGGEKTQLCTEGLLVEQDGKAALLYQEIDPQERSATQVMMRLEKEGVMVMRGGEPFTSVFFREGKTCESEYTTAGQSLLLRMFPTQVRVERRGLSGHVHIVYQVTLGLLGASAMETAMRTLDVRFRPVQERNEETPAGKKRALRRWQQKPGPQRKAQTHPEPEPPPLETGL